MDWSINLFDWALGVEPSALPEQFKLRQACAVTNPGTWLRAIQADIRSRSTARRKWGALHADLRRLYEITEWKQSCEK